jgi:Imelysin
VFRFLVIARAALVAMALSLVVRPGVPVAAQDANPGTADLAGLKTYMVDHVTKMKSGTAEVLAFAQQYYDLAKAANFDYQALWQQHGAELVPMLEQARQQWSEDAHGNYELNEGMVAGIPALSHFDVLIDAGPSGADDPSNALDFQVKLPDGRVLDKPGNLFHYLTEPALWGTEDAFVGLRVDMNGNGTIDLGEALPEANVMLGSAQALDAATADLAKAIGDWQPTLDDAFTALVGMIPTINGYFNEWKLSPLVLGDKSTEHGYVANSRLIDVLGIFGGLQLTYSKVDQLVAGVNPELAGQIQDQLGQVVGFVQNLHDKEQAGTRYAPEQADVFGQQLQDQCDAIAGQVAQAAALLGITLEQGA